MAKNDYHIRELDDGTWIVSCYEEGKKGVVGKQIEYSYANLEDALGDIKNGFKDEEEKVGSEDKSPTETKAKEKVKKMMSMEDDDA